MKNPEERSQFFVDNEAMVDKQAANAYKFFQASPSLCKLQEIYIYRLASGYNCLLEWLNKQPCTTRSPVHMQPCNGKHALHSQRAAPVTKQLSSLLSLTWMTVADYT